MMNNASNNMSKEKIESEFSKYKFINSKFKDNISTQFSTNYDNNLIESNPNSKIKVQKISKEMLTDSNPETVSKKLTEIKEDDDPMEIDDEVMKLLYGTQSESHDTPIKLDDEVMKLLYGTQNECQESLPKKDYDEQRRIVYGTEKGSQETQMELDDDDLMGLIYCTPSSSQEININQIPTIEGNKNKYKVAETIKEYYKVIDVETKMNSEDKKTIVIKCEPCLLEKEEDQFTIDFVKTVHLEGLWADVLVNVTDIVYISATYNKQEHHYEIAAYDYLRSNLTKNTNGKNNSIGLENKNVQLLDNFIIVEPEILLSPSRIKTAFPCLRRSVFNEQFKMIINPNKSSTKEIFIGQVIHEVFESTIKEFSKNISKDLIKDSYINQRIDKVLKNYTLDFALNDFFPGDMEKLAKNYVKNIMNFFMNYFIIQKDLTGLKIKRYYSSEKVYQSQVLGMKGIIDMLVETSNESNTTEITPVELKTGNYQSNQDIMQVLVYCLILSEQMGTDSYNGILVYIKQQSQMRIKVNKNDIVKVIVTRNNIAKLVKNLNEDHQNYKYGLPPLYNKITECSKCFQKDICNFHHYNYEESQNEVQINNISMLNNDLSDKTEIQKLLMDNNSQEYFNLFYEIINREETSAYAREKNEIKDGEILDLQDFKKYVIEKSVLKENSFEIIIFSEEDYLNNFNNNVGADEEIVSQFTYMNDGYHIYEPVNQKSFKGILVNKSDNVKSTKFTLNILKMYISKIRSQISLWEDPRVKYLYLKNVNATAKYPYKLMRGNLMSVCMNLKPELKEILINHKKPEFDNNDKTNDEIKQIIKSFEQEFLKLNKNQRTAIIKALKCKDYSLVIGFPGSGKTTLIALLVCMLVKMKKRVLVAAHTNVAVDNIMIKLKEKNVDFVRISNNENSIDHQIRENIFSNKNCQTWDEWKQFKENTLVYGVTTLGIYNKVLVNLQFDYCIVDEACQIFEPTLLGPLLISQKFVLVGDPFQLPALLRSQESPPTSLFERLYNKYSNVGVELIEQFRMNKEILNLSNKCVYADVIKCANESVSKRRLNIDIAELQKFYWIPQWVSDVLDPDRPVIFCDYNKYVQATQPEFITNTADMNEIESSIIQRILSAFKDLDFDMNDIGVITPYKAQESLLTSTLRNLDFFNVYTIDKSQGTEKEVIIISFVKTNHRTKILKDIARINVAFTRPKSKLIIIGLIDYLSNITKLAMYMNMLKNEKWVYELDDI